MNDNNENSNLIDSGDPIKSYKRRWIMLFISSVNIFLDAMMFSGLAGINNIASTYYNVSSVSIEYLTNMMSVGVIMLALPSSYLITRFGVKPLLIISAFVHSFVYILRCFAYEDDRFWLVAVSQVPVAIVTATMLNIPARVSSLWFPIDERTTSTSIAIAFGSLGLGVGNLLPTLLVKTHINKDKTGSELKTLYISQLVLSIFITIITLFYEEKPPTSSSQHKEEETSFKKGLIILKENRNFWVVSQAFGLYFALLYLTPTLVNSIVTSKFHNGYEGLIGTMALCNILAGLISFVCIGKLVDKYHKYRLTAVLLNFSSSLFLLVFFLILTYNKNFVSVFVFYVILGFSNFSYLSIGLEQAVQITYPVDEHISTAVMMVFANIYQFLFTVAFGILIEKGLVGIAGYSMVVLYLISTLFAWFCKTDQNENRMK